MHKLLSFFLLLAVTLQTTAQSSVDSCSMPPLPTVHFREGSVFLNAKAKAALDSAVIVIKEYPKCKVKVIGYSWGEDTQDSWDRVQSVINYLVKKGIGKDKLIFVYGQLDATETVDLRGTSEDGASTLPPPHPNFKHHVYSDPAGNVQ